MIDCCEGAIQTSNLSSSIGQSFESLGRSDFVHEVAVDIEKNRSIVLLVDDVALEDLVVPVVC